MTETVPAATAIVADDESHLRSYLISSLQRLWPSLKIVGEAANGREALELIASQAPQIAFLDIRMPGLTGLQVAEKLPGGTRVVFVTAYDQYALDAFDRAAVDYLLKPLDEARLAETIGRLQSSLADKMPQLDSALLAQLGEVLARKPLEYLKWIRVGAGGTTRILDVEDILYFRADHKYTTVRTFSGEQVIRRTIKDLEQTLDPSLFWRVHRSTLLNIRFLDSASRDFRGRYTLRLKGVEDTLKVSDTYSHLFKQM